MFRHGAADARRHTGPETPQRSTRDLKIDCRPLQTGTVRADVAIPIDVFLGVRGQLLSPFNGRQRESSSGGAHGTPLGSDPRRHGPFLYWVPLAATLMR
jgi:hypothetical protein